MNMSPLSFDTRFGWRGVDANGADKRGKTIAADSAHARATLKRDGVTVLELTALGSAPPPKARAADVTLFTRQLAGLLRAGLPLASSLDLIADTPLRGGLPRIVGSVARDITQGVAFSAALARHPACFNALYCQLVAVGEVAGALPVVLARAGRRPRTSRRSTGETACRADLSGRGAVVIACHYRRIADWRRANLQDHLRWFRR